MNLTDFAWAAGFIDGEGYITVARHPAWTGVRKSGPDAGVVRREREQYQLLVMVSQNNPAPLERLVALFGGSCILCRRSGRQRIDHWRWRVSSAEALAALELMLPYFVGKSELAILAVQYQRWIIASKVPGRAMPIERRREIERYYSEFKRLNARWRYVKPQTAEGRVLSWPDSSEAEQLATGSGG